VCLQGLQAWTNGSVEVCRAVIHIWGERAGCAWPQSVWLCSLPCRQDM
jgi:hypothetical protein